MKKYPFIGPESTGKSETSRRVAERINGVYVPEISRDYLKDIKTDYTVDDIYNIAKLQKQEEKILIDVFGDTNYLVDTESICIYIWLNFYDYPVPDWLIETIESDDYTLYLLCDIDMPWAYDPLRQNPYNRRQLFDNFVEALHKFNKPYKVLRGIGERRIENALGFIEETLT